jgi:hypothetical protein
MDDRLRQINLAIQEQLAARSISDASAVEAARWLDEQGLLADSDSRPGKPLRDLLRRGLIEGQRLDPNGRWHISRSETSSASSDTRKSEVYRGVTIDFTAEPIREWSFEFDPGSPRQSFRSAFQARRRINELIDGGSDSQPRRDDRTKHRRIAAADEDIPGEDG